MRSRACSKQLAIPRPSAVVLPGAALQWGWSGSRPGDWAELEFDSREHKDPAAASESPGNQKMAEVYLTHLKGYEGFGTASLQCVSGCICSGKGRVLDGTWKQKATLMQIHRFQVRADARRPAALAAAFRAAWPALRGMHLLQPGQALGMA